MSTVAAEAARQQALVAAIAGATEPVHGALRLARGLAIYRANAELLAERVLAARHPLLLQMLGEQALALLARALWRAHPPRRGDIAQWGHELPALVEAQPELAPWSWLADVARLELLRAACESAADALPEPATVQLLAEREPLELRIELMPSLQLMRSDWPLDEIVAVHARTPDDAALAALGERLRAPLDEPQHVVVARRGWRAEVTSATAADWRWMAALRRGLALVPALAAAGDGFDVAAWLGRALQAGWFRRVGVVPHAALNDPGER